MIFWQETSTSVFLTLHLFHTVKVLLEAGANVNAVNMCECTSLILAAWNGHAEVVKLLVNAKVDINAKAMDGCTALMKAARWGKANVVKMDKSIPSF